MLQSNKSIIEHPSLLPLVLALLRAKLQRRITLDLGPELTLHALLTCKLAIEPERSLLDVVVRALENGHGEEARRRHRRGPVLRDGDLADFAVVGFPALDGVAHRPHGVHVPAAPHVGQIVGAAQRAVDGAVPGVQSVALVLVAIPGVYGVGAFRCIQVWTHEDVGALEEAGHLPEEGLVLGNLSVIIVVYAKWWDGVHVRLWVTCHRQRLKPDLRRRCL